MKALRVLAGLIVVLAIAACASQEEAPEEAAPEESEVAREQQEADETAARATRPDVLDTPGIATFHLADGTELSSGSVVTLPTGGPDSGRLIPSSTSSDVRLYVTRDGSVPSTDNHWGEPIDPENPVTISGMIAGLARYRVVAELDGAYSEPFALNVFWEHEESPDLDAPIFLVDGREVSARVEIPVSSGNDPAARLEISCNYEGATLFITRDGSEPTVDNYWESLVCQGTYIWSPEPTAAQYRVVALWQGVRSPVASLEVEWVE